MLMRQVFEKGFHCFRNWFMMGILIPSYTRIYNNVY